jgi:hypothetical protein
VDCLNDSHCPGDGNMCSGDNYCDANYTCNRRMQSPCNGSTPFCEVSTQSCNECLVDNDCIDRRNYCLLNWRCIYNSTLAYRQCVINETRDCLCDALGSRCVDCFTSADCTPTFCGGAGHCNTSQICQYNPLTPCDTAQPRPSVCHEASRSCLAVQCRVDEDCPPNYNWCIDRVVCDQTNYSCVEIARVSSPNSPRLCDQIRQRFTQCLNDSDCDDSVWCNGNEVCRLSDGHCLTDSPPPCNQLASTALQTNTPVRIVCSEKYRKCYSGLTLCSSDDDCQDHLFCTGIKRCRLSSGECYVDITQPACAHGITCNEEFDICGLVITSVSDGWPIYLFFSIIMGCSFGLFVYFAYRDSNDVSRTKSPPKKQPPVPDNKLSAYPYNNVNTTLPTTRQNNNVKQRKLPGFNHNL